MTVLSLSDHWPSNKRMSLRVYMRNDKKMALPSFLSECSQNLLATWLWMSLAPEMVWQNWLITAILIVSNSKTNILIFLHLTPPKMKPFFYIMPHNWKWIWPHWLGTTPEQTRDVEAATLSEACTERAVIKLCGLCASFWWCEHCHFEGFVDAVLSFAWMPAQCFLFQAPFGGRNAFIYCRVV